MSKKYFKNYFLMCSILCILGISATSSFSSEETKDAETSNLITQMTNLILETYFIEENEESIKLPTKDDVELIQRTHHAHYIESKKEITKNTDPYYYLKLSQDPITLPLKR